MSQQKYIVIVWITQFIRYLTEFVYRVVLNHSNQLQQPSILKTETIKYYDVAKTKFLKTFESETDTNSNIDALFYDKTQYTKEMEIYNNDQEQIWKRRILMDSTPRGNLIMYYDPYKLGFAYYSDVYMPYHILNAAAMKYVVMFRCRDFFVDELIVPETQPSKLIKLYFIENDSKPKSKESTTTTTKQNSAVFAQLKNYNKPGGRVSSESVALKTEIKNEKVMNIFVNLGKMANYSIIKKTPKLFANNGFRSGLLPAAKEMSWSDYKKSKSVTSNIVSESKLTTMSLPKITKTNNEISKEIDESTMFLPDDNDIYEIVKDDLSL
jgi:hypothetical protein